MDTSAIDQVLQDGVDRGVFPGAVLVVSRAGEVLHEKAIGVRSSAPDSAPMHPEIVFDLASLTKPLATTPAFLLLVKQGRLTLEDRVTRFFHNFGVHGKNQVTFHQLLTHSSGLPAHRHYYKEASKLSRHRLNFLGSRAAKEWTFEQIHREKLEYTPGERALYSDLGFILLGQAIETISGAALDRFCQRHFFGPLGLRSTSFIDLSKIRTRRVEPVADMIAPTQKCPWRKRVLCGEVDDENAWLMGGVAGHAGLFASARDVDRFARALEAASRGEGDVLPQSLIEQMWTVDAEVPDSTRTLGWDTPSARGSAVGTLVSPRTVGHLGFTGTSLWIDRDRRLIITLLSNRVHPSRDNERIREWRPRLHDAVLEAVG